MMIEGVGEGADHQNSSSFHRGCSHAAIRQFQISLEQIKVESEKNGDLILIDQVDASVSTLNNGPMSLQSCFEQSKESKMILYWHST